MLSHDLFVTSDVDAVYLVVRHKALHPLNRALNLEVLRKMFARYFVTPERTVSRRREAPVQSRFLGAAIADYLK
jgi:hypothetical protein